MKPIFFALPVLLAFSTLGHAQSNLPDYDAQKRASKAVRFNSLAEMKAQGASLKGKTVELKGEIKGTFSRGESLAAMFAPADGTLLVLDAPDALKTTSALRPGARTRVLLRVDSLAGSEPVFTLLNASDTPEADPLFKIDDDPSAPIVMSPMTEMLVPNGAVSVLPEAPRPMPATRGSLPTRGALPSRGTDSRVMGLTLDPNQQLAYKALAQRYNSKLDDAMAGQIAAGILSASQTYNIDPRFLAAIVTVESSFDPYCLSSSGAMGLGQIMPFNLKGLGIQNAWEPMQNLQGAAKLLRQNLDRFGAYKDSTLLAVAAYHAGGTAVQNAGFQVPNKPATQRYVWKVYYAYKALAPDLFQ